MPVKPGARAHLFFVGSVLGVVIATGAVAGEPSSAQCAAAYENTQLLRRSGHLVAARDAAVTCARPVCPEFARKDCATWEVEIGREVPSVVVIAREETTDDGSGARVLVDGTVRPEASTGRAFELDPGKHLFRVERPGDRTVEQTIEIFQGERDRIIRFALHPEGAPLAPATATSPPTASSTPPGPPPAPSSTVVASPSYVPAIVVGGASIALFGASAWLGLTGRSDLSNLRATCAPTCTDAQVDPVRTRLVLSDITLGAGVVGAAISIYLFARPPRESSSGVQVDVAPTTGGAALLVRSAF
jgi:hypothetical protein